MAFTFKNDKGEIISQAEMNSLMENKKKTEEELLEFIKEYTTTKVMYAGYEDEELPNPIVSEQEIAFFRDKFMTNKYDHLTFVEAFAKFINGELDY